MVNLMRMLLVRGGYMAPEDDGSGGGGSGGGGGGDDKGGKETFSREYVKELREENKGYRLKAAEAEGKLKAALEDVGKAKTTHDEAISNLTKDMQAKILRAELKSAAIAAGMIDLDGLKLADLSKVTLKDDGTIEGAEKLFEDLKTAKPYLFGAANNSNGGKPPPAKDQEAKSALEMTDDEYKAARRKAAGR